MEAFLAERGLTLSAHKTRITAIEDGFDFLGQHIRKYTNTCRVTPAKKNVKAFMATVRTIISKHKQARTDVLIARLNPLLRGWANYHRSVLSRKVFSKVDDQLWRWLWQWSLRRHPNKSRTWVLHKYFKPRRGRRWVFSGQTEKGEWVSLPRLTSLPQRRHIKVRSNANPYDLAYATYFEQRTVTRWRTGIEGRTKLKKLWLPQKGKCPVCKDLITEETGWNVHHVIRRANGGDDKPENLALLHPVCHQQLHANENRRYCRVSSRGLLKSLSVVR